MGLGLVLLERGGVFALVEVAVGGGVLGVLLGAAGGRVKG